MNNNSLILILIYSLGCLITTSCSNTNKKVEETVTSDRLPYLIDLESGFDNFKKVNLSEIADSVEYITIETSPQCLIRYTRDIKLTSNYLFISDFEGLYKFSRKGKFICSVGRKGNGPGEYTNVRTFTIDETNELVYVVDNGRKQIEVFNFNGEFIKSVKIDLDLQNLAIYNNSTLAYSVVCSGAVANQYNLLLIDNNTGEVKNKYNDYYNIKGMHFFDFMTLTKHKEQLYFNDAFCDTLFVINEEMKEMPFCVFNMGKYQILDTHSQMAKVSMVQRIILTEHNILFLYGSPLKDNFMRTAVYNKHTSQLTNVTPIDDQSFNGYCGFYNDFDGIVHFWPKFIGENGELIYYYDIFRLGKIEELNLKNNISETFKSKKDHDFIKTTIANKKIEDNGILLIVHPKKIEKK